MSSTFIPPKPSEWQGPQIEGFVPPPISSWEGPSSNPLKSGFIGRFGETLSGLGHAVTHPLETAKSMVTPSPEVAKEASDAFNKGQYGRYALSQAEDVPIAGPILRQLEQDLKNKDWGAVAATAVMLGGPSALKAIGKIPAMAGAASTTGTALKGAAKGGMEAFIQGKSSIPAAAGGVIGHMVGGPEGAEIGAGLGALPGTVQGMVKGAKTALNPPKVPSQTVAPRAFPRISGSGFADDPLPAPKKPAPFVRAQPGPEFTPEGNLASPPLSRPSPAPFKRAVPGPEFDPEGNIKASSPAQIQESTPPLTKPPASTPQGSRIITPEGVPERYGEAGSKLGSKYIQDAFAKDQAVASHLRAKGITPEAFDAADQGTLNSWAKEVNPRYKGINPDRVGDLRNMLFPQEGEIPKFAEGGIVDEPTLGLVGEEGPEAIIPLTSEHETVPEKPETLGIQISQLLSGQRRVIMLPKGSPNVSVQFDKSGNQFLFDPSKISRQDIHAALVTNNLPKILGSSSDGMGAPDKSRLHSKNPSTIVAEAQDGTEVQSAVTDKAHLPQTVKAAKKILPPGGSIRAKNPADVLKSRVLRPPMKKLDLSSPGSVR